MTSTNINILRSLNDKLFDLDDFAGAIENIYIAVEYTIKTYLDSIPKDIFGIDKSKNTYSLFFSYIKLLIENKKIDRKSTV